MLHVMSPAWLFGLLLMPLLALLHWQTVQREREALEDFAGVTAQRKMGIRSGADLRLWRGLCVIAALACLLVALAQPRWGAAGGASVSGQTGSVVLVLDVSKSMRVRDMGGDSRLKAVQMMVSELLPQLAGWRVGVVAFAGEAEVLCPLTTDHDAVRTLLARARTGTVPGKGSNMEVGLEAAVKLFRQPGPRAVILLSDGEALSGKAPNGAAALAAAKVSVLAIGYGTAQGGRIPGESDVWGNPTFVTYRGDAVVSKLDAAALTQLATATGGIYASGSDPTTQAAIATTLGLGAAAPTEKPEAAVARVSAPFELFQLPLALALFLLMGEGLLALAGRPRRVVRFTDVLQRVRPRHTSVALMWVAIALSQSAWTWYPTWLPNGEAGEAYQAGDLPRAEGLLRGALEHDPENFRLRYNLGNVLYERGNFVAAAKVYEEALRTSDDATKPLVRYNLGNAHFREAEKRNTTQGYERAIAAYEDSLKDRPGDADAAHNLAVAKERLKKQKNNSGGGKNGQNGQGQAAGGNNAGGATPIGVQTRYKPPPLSKHLPSKGEVDSLLRALESDERQRQAEQAMDPPTGNGGLDPRNLLDQALGGLDLDKDW